MTTAIRKGTVNLLITKFSATQVNYCTLYFIYFLDCKDNNATDKEKKNDDSNS